MVCISKICLFLINFLKNMIEVRLGTNWYVLRIILLELSCQNFLSPVTVPPKITVRELHCGLLGKVVLFEHNSYTVRWTSVLRSREGWPKACGEPCSIKLVSIIFCERSTWILRFCDTWLLGIVMNVQVSRFTAQFCENTERFNLKVIQY